MRIIFMGTPDFAAVSLKRLYDEGCDILAVFTQPDRPKNRGMKLAPSPVKTLALQHGTPVFEPETVKDPDVFKIFADYEPDLIAVVAYGQLLPKEILESPRLGCINIHASLLPKYRGSAPIQHAVLNGDEVTGVTSMYMAERMDAGDIIISKSTEIGEYDTSGDMFLKLQVLGADLLLETLSLIEAGTAPRIPQDESAVTFAPPLSRDQSPIDWSLGCNAVINHIRGQNPWPVATAEFGGRKFKIYSAIKGGEEIPAEPGSIISAGKDGLEVACGSGSVIITELQAPGGKRMKSADYLRGHKI